MIAINAQLYNHRYILVKLSNLMINSKNRHWLIWLLVALPLAIFAYNSIKHISTEYQFSQKELVGSHYHANAYKLLLSVQQLRGLNYLESATHNEQASILALQKKLSLQINNVDRKNAETKALKLEKEWAKVKAALTLAFLQAKTLSPEEAFIAQSKAANKLKALLTDIQRNSNLLLDPELPTYDTMTVMLSIIPEMTNILGYWRGKISGESGPNKRLMQSDQLALNAAISRLQDLNESAHQSLIYAKTGEQIIPLDNAMMALEQLANGQPLQNPKAFFSMMSGAIDHFYGIYLAHQHRLESLLNNRITSLKKSMNGLLGLLFMSALAFIWVIHRRQKSQLESLAAANELTGIFNAMTDSTLVMGADGVIQKTNRAATNMFGYQAEQMLGKNLHMLIADSNLSAYQAYFQSVLTNRSDAPAESIGQRIDGTTFPIECMITKSQLDGKAIYIATITDIEIRKLAEQAEEAQKAQFVQLLENQSVAMFLIDKEHRVVHWNKACEILTGVLRADIVGTKESWSGFYHRARPCLADMVLSQDLSIANSYYPIEYHSKLTEKGWHAEAWFDNLGGKKRYVIFDAAPIKDADGNITAVVETLQDITESKLIEEKLQIATQKELESSQKIKSLFNNVFDGLMVLDDEGKIETANKAVIKIFGYEPESLIGKSMNQLISSNADNPFNDYVQAYAATTLKSSNGQMYDVLGLHQNGQTFTMELVINEAVMDGEHKFICTTRDVTQRRYMDRLYRLMWEEVEGYASLILDPDGRIQTWNAGAQTLKGYHADEIIGKSISTFYTEEDLAENLTEQLLETCRRDGHVKNEGWRVRKDGSLFFAEVVINRLSEDDGTLLGFVKVTRDATARKKLDNELKQAYNNLEEFTAVASHDLRSPLRGIGDLVEWVKEDLADVDIDDVNKNLDRVSLRVKRMETLIEDLLQYSRAGKTYAELSLVDPIELVNEILELQPVPTDFEITVTGNARAFKTAKTPLQTSVRNIISNAIKHHDQPNGNIDITVKAVGSYCVVSIRDDGPGIPTAAKERVFKLFQTLSSNKESSGIGLAVTKRMVEAHDGYIELDTNENERGTTFHIWWPRFQTILTND